MEKRITECLLRGVGRNGWPKAGKGFLGVVSSVQTEGHKSVMAAVLVCGRRRQLGHGHGAGRVADGSGVGSLQDPCFREGGGEVEQASLGSTLGEEGDERWGQQGARDQRSRRALQWCHGHKAPRDQGAALPFGRRMAGADPVLDTESGNKSQGLFSVIPNVLSHFHIAFSPLAQIRQQQHLF